MRILIKYSKFLSKLGVVTTNFLICPQYDSTALDGIGWCVLHCTGVTTRNKVRLFRDI